MSFQVSFTIIPEPTMLYFQLDLLQIQSKFQLNQLIIILNDISPQIQIFSLISIRKMPPVRYCPLCIVLPYRRVMDWTGIHFRENELVIERDQPKVEGFSQVQVISETICSHYSMAKKCCVLFINQLFWQLDSTTIPQHIGGMINVTVLPVPGMGNNSLGTFYHLYEFIGCLLHLVLLPLL